MLLAGRHTDPMTRRTIAALALPFALLAGCSQSTPAAQPSPAVSSPATPKPTPTATPTPSPSVDCGPTSTISQAEWMEHCATPEASTAPKNGGLSKWSAAGESGTLATIDFSAQASDKGAEAVRRAAKLAGKTAPAMYPVQIDNSYGETDAAMYGATVIDKAGQQTESVSADELISGWMDEIGSDSSEDIERYNAMVDILNELQADLKPGAKGDTFVAFKEPLKGAARVHVMLNDGFTSTEAYPHQG